MKPQKPEIIEINNKPVVKESDKKLMKLTYWFGGLGVVLPFILPESDVLVNTSIFQWLEQFVPSAKKASTVAAHPNVVWVYFTLMFIAAPFWALVFVRYSKWRDRCTPIRYGFFSSTRHF
jgi:hypothetical protein